MASTSNPSVGQATESVRTRLEPCPGPPNCVCSQARDDRHRVAPFELREPATETFRQVARVVAETARTRVVDQSDTYLHAEARSRIFRFVDDLELLLEPEGGIVNVRSASRVGHGDLGVNRRRVEALRKRLAELGLLRRG